MEKKEQEHFYQVGVMVKRDKITGEDLGEVIPLYAKSKHPIGENGMTVEEQNLLNDLAKTFADLYETEQKAASAKC